MTLLDELGRRAGATVRDRAHALVLGDRAPVWERVHLRGAGDSLAALHARHRRRGRARALAATAVAALALVAVAPTVRSALNPGPRVGLYVGPPPAGTTTEPPPPPPATRTEGGTAGFSAGSGLVVLFDDGYDGVLAMDLDAGVAARRVLDGQRAGDQPWR